MAEFSRWGESSLGQSLLARERHLLREHLPGLRGDVAIQVGATGTTPLLDASPIVHRFLVGDRDDRPLNGETTRLVTTLGDGLPFASDSVDLCLLPHVLDYSPQPHLLLREVQRVLTSSGHAVVLGFNPWSLWGARKLLSPSQPPWHGRFIGIRRMRDWLSLLDFEITAGVMLYYRPPLSSHALRDRLRFLEKAGDRWWPMFAAAYMLLAQKREAGMTVIELRQRFRRPRYLGAAEPVARGSHKLYE